MRESHGCANSRFYKTWITIHHRCYNPNYKDYKHVGGNGIKVCPDWHKDNPNGLLNFVVWCEEWVAKHPELQSAAILAVARNKRTDDYSPKTCKIGVKGYVECPSKNSNMTERKVVNLRRLFRINKTITVTAAAKKYKMDRHAIRDSLIGTNWARVNHIEPPLTKEEMVRQRTPKQKAVD